MSPTIPKTQTAAVVPSSGADIEIRHDHPVKSQEELAPGECLIKLACTGVRSNTFARYIWPLRHHISKVCHTDLHAALGDWPLPAKTPLVGGHEGVGEIVAIGNNTSHSPVKVGDRVGVKWLADS
jgi:propanol-preferring alcohol dehydrogenase